MRTPVEIRPRGGAQKPHREKALKEKRYNVKRARSSAWIERRRSGSAGEGALFVINDYDIHTLLPSFVAPKSFSGVQATT